ncbi:MAG TPA: helix-turn-helix transcriptional regulator [Mycobacterium sp.]|nr:helix-turn-helix transcriptional regulator [Mycobacterium sp.]
MAYQVTSLGISVLALLRERRMHCYEMFVTLASRHPDRIRKVRPGSLYHVVYRLADEKLIRPTGTCRSGNRPERTTYELTDAGAGALAERVCEPVANPVSEFDKFAVALAEIGHLDVDTAVEALRRRISQLELSSEEMAELPGSRADQPVMAALDYLLATTTAQIDWLHRFVDTLRVGRDGALQ